MSDQSDILKYLRNLPEDDPIISEVQDLISGFSPPYVEGSEKPGNLGCRRQLAQVN